MTDFTPEEKLLNLIKNDQSKARIGKDLKIFTKVNILLMGVIGIVAIIFLADVFIFKEKSSIGPAAVDIQRVETVPSPQPQAVIEEKKEESAAVKKISKSEIAGNLNLLGIITGDNNQAIIEDKTLKKTFFVYKGDLLGELKVYDIKESVVILEYEGEKVELKI